MKQAALAGRTATIFCAVFIICVATLFVPWTAMADEQGKEPLQASAIVAATIDFGKYSNKVPQFSLYEYHFGKSTLRGSLDYAEFEDEYPGFFEVPQYSSAENYLAVKYKDHFTGADVVLEADGKQYRTIVQEWGTFMIEGIEPIRPGSQMTISISKYGSTSIQTMTAPEDERFASLFFKRTAPAIFPKSKRAKIQLDGADPAMAGDIFVLKIGNKKYKKRYSGETKQDITLTFKIKKPKKAGATVRVTHYNMFGKKLDSDKSIVWRGKKIHIGDTKKQVKMTYGFGEPHRINRTPYSEQWVYSYSSKNQYVYFRNGKVSYWQL